MRAALFFLLLASTAAASTIRVEDDEGLGRALGRLRPGTTVLLAPGTYRGGLSARDVHGTEARPIVIAGADRERPPVIEGGGSGLHVAGAAWLTIRDLVIRGATGNGLNVDDGGTIETPAHHVKILRVTVRDIGPRGNRDGIKLSGVDDFEVRDCLLERWGEGGSGVDMVGCHEGEIVGCTFRHAEGPSGSGVQAKGGCRKVAVRRCRFEHARARAVNLGGSTGRPYFRPRDPGYEAKDLTVEDCTFVGSMAPVAFVGVDGALVRHNTFYRPTKWLLRILQESGGPDFTPCRNGRFERNLIVFRSTDIRTAVNIGPGTKSETFTFSENWWYCEDRPAASRVKLPSVEKKPVHGKDPRLVDPEGGNPNPVRGSPASRYGVRPRDE